MTIRYRASASFDAKQEMETLIKRFSNPPADELESIVDAMDSLLSAKSTGFNGMRDKWDGTEHEDLFLYSDQGVLAAVNVPGNGRAQTFDLTFIGMAVVTVRASDQFKAAVETFLLEMVARRRTGTEHVWV